MVRVQLVAVAVALVVVSVAVAAGAGVTTLDASGVVVLDGQRIFPIVLAKGPPPDGTTPSGGNAFAEVVGAGVNFLKVGPATVPWTAADVDEAKLEDQAAAAHGAHTWVNLATLSRGTPGSAADAVLSQVVTSLEQDPSGTAIGMWKGADEPWWSGIAPTALQFVYCRATGRGDASWCGGEPALDQDHLWVTIQAPRGTSIHRPRPVRSGQRCARRRRLSGDRGKFDTRPARGRKLDEHDRGCDAVARCLDDTADLCQRERPRRRQLRPADS